MNPSYTPRYGPSYGMGEVPFMIVGLVFVVLFIVGIFVAFSVSGTSQDAGRSDSPVVEELACVIAKRTEVSQGGSRNAYLNTTYYVTFEDEAGKRRELTVEGQEFGMMIEGDQGNLIYQGTEFKDFVRDAAYSDR